MGGILVAMTYNRPSMGAERLLRFVFVFYCTMVGGILVTLPWSPSWSIMVAHLPIEGLRWLDQPLARGGLSGFGLVHLVWALHDMAALGQPPTLSHESERPENPGD